MGTKALDILRSSKLQLWHEQTVQISSLLLLALKSKVVKLPRPVLWILASLLCFIRIPVKICQHMFWLAWYLFLGLLILVSVGVTVTTISYYSTEYSISRNEQGHYHHDQDEATTAIVNYITLGQLTAEEKLVVIRLYIRNMYRKAGMPTPPDIMARDLNGLADLIREWQKRTNPHEGIDDALFNAVFSEAVEAPIEERGLRSKAYTQTWLALDEDGHSPRVRWMENQNDIPSWIITTSSKNGSGQSYYNSFNHTILINYESSFESLVDEISHANQFREHPVSSYTRMTIELLHATGCYLRNMPGGILSYYKNGYKQPGAIEYEAHEVITPEIIRKRKLKDVIEKAETKPSPEHTRKLNTLQTLTPSTCSPTPSQ